LVFTGCDAKSDEKREDKKADAKAPEEPHGDHHYFSVEIAHAATGTEVGVASTSSSEAGEDDSGSGEALPDCPKDQARLEDGSCAPEEEFFAEQEILDEQAVAQMQYADSPKQEAKAQGDLIKHQSRQIEQAEKDLDEIIEEVKKRKKSGGGKKGGKEADPFD
jgi:hypothetical protein